MARAHLHGLAALLLIAGGLLFVLTDTVAAAAIGLVCIAAAGILMLLARGRS